MKSLLSIILLICSGQLLSTELFVGSNNIRNKIKEYEWKNHRPIDYRTAKKVLFYDVFKHTDSNGKTYVQDVYCHAIRYLKKKRKINIEHTWPQSKFNPNFDKKVQKSDLYHLFLTDKVVNNQRANFPFGEVIGEDAGQGDCPSSQIGLVNSTDYPVRGSQTFFEPPEEIRGDIARGLFYFAIKYDLHIASVQEFFLRKWNRDDPVSQEERGRMQEIQKIQGNLNPFIEDASLAERITDF